MPPRKMAGCLLQDVSLVDGLAIRLFLTRWFVTDSYDPTDQAVADNCRYADGLGNLAEKALVDLFREMVTPVGG